MKNLLITGGTGSFGKTYLKTILKNHDAHKRVVVYSRDEVKQWEIRKQYPEDKYPQLRLFIGDVRDRERLKRAMEDVDTVIHAAALKQVPTAEYNPMEFVKTNVIGAENIIEASLDQGVKRVIALSTDKAAAPINLYGATKLCSDKLFIAANNIKGGRDLRLSVVRYGNVMGSRGSVVPLFQEQSKTGCLTITDSKMTRFNITLDQAVKMVSWVTDNALGGEIFVPKIPSYRITDLAKAISPNSEIKIVGIRPGEKIHEEMITISDSASTIDLGNYYAILPSDGKLIKEYERRNIKYEKVKEGFTYNSGTNTEFLNTKELSQLTEPILQERNA